MTRIISLAGVFFFSSAPLFGQIDSLFEEDPQRLFRVWEERLPPEDYQKAYDSLYPPDSFTRARYPFDWEAVGPIGKHGYDEIQGRVNQVKFLSTGGGSYDIYAGACSGGLWKSAETPVEWTDLGHRLPNPSVGAVAPVIDYPDSIYVGCGEFGRYGGSGMYLSTNGGTNWNLVSLPVWTGCFYRIYDLDDATGSMVAACWSGILHTTDKSSWTLAHNGLCTDLVVVPNNKQLQFACAFDLATDELTVYESTDGGASWTRIPGAPSCSVGGLTHQRFEVRGSIALCYGDPANMAVMLTYLDITDDVWRLAGVWRSPDGGSTWNNITTADLDDFGWGQLFHAQAIAIRPYNPDYIYMGGVILASTDDGGTTWDVDYAENGIDIGHADIADLCFRMGDTDTLWIPNDGGLFIHDLNSGTTTSYNGDVESGLNILQIDFMDAERAFWALGLQDDGVFTTINGAATWQHLWCSDGGDMEITDNEAHKWWFSSGAGFNIYRGTVGGAVDAVSGQIYESYIQHFFFDRYAGKVYTADSAYIYSADAPGGPATISPAFHLDPFDKGKSTICGDYVDGKTIYAVYWDDTRISVCRESGGSWTCTERDLGSTNVYRVATVTASPQNTREAWAGLVGGSGAAKILHTDDAWANWTDITGTTGNLNLVGHVFSIVVTPFNEDQIFVGTDMGVFWTQNGGQDWEPFMDGMPIVRCSELRYLVDTAHTYFDKLAAATYGHGNYVRRMLGTPIVFVDKRNTTGVEDGTIDHPFNTFDEGVDYAPVGAIVAIHGDTYPDPTPAVVSKQLRLESYESSALIGSSSK